MEDEVTDIPMGESNEKTETSEIRDKKDLSTSLTINSKTENFKTPFKTNGLSEQFNQLVFESLLTSEKREKFSLDNRFQRELWVAYSDADREDSTQRKQVFRECYLESVFASDTQSFDTNISFRSEPQSRYSLGSTIQLICPFCKQHMASLEVQIGSLPENHYDNNDNISFSEPNSTVEKIAKRQLMVILNIKQVTALRLKIAMIQHYLATNVMNATPYH